MSGARLVSGPLKGKLPISNKGKDLAGIEAVTINSYGRFVLGAESGQRQIFKLEKEMKLRTVLVVAALFAAASFASAQKMIVDVDSSVDFRSFKTFGFSKGQIAPKPSTSKLLETAIVRELISRGLVRKDDDPDVTITVLAAAGMDLQGVGPTWNNEHYKSWGGYGNPAALMTVTTGNLLIDIFTTKANNGVFRGVAREIFVATPSGNSAKDEQQMEKTVNKTVGKMFKKYPVKPGK